MDPEVKMYQEVAYATLKKITKKLDEFSRLQDAINFLELTMKKMRESSTRDLDKDSEKWA